MPVLLENFPGDIILRDNYLAEILSWIYSLLDQNACVAALQKAALDAGLQIPGLPGGMKMFGTNNSVNVSGASVSVSQF